MKARKLAQHIPAKKYVEGLMSEAYAWLKDHGDPNAEFYGGETYAQWLVETVCDFPQFLGVYSTNYAAFTDVLARCELLLYDDITNEEAAAELAVELMWLHHCSHCSGTLTSWLPSWLEDNAEVPDHFIFRDFADLVDLVSDEGLDVLPDWEHTALEIAGSIPQWFIVDVITPKAMKALVRKEKKAR